MCQQVVDKKDVPNIIFGVIPYLAPEVSVGIFRCPIDFHLDLSCPIVQMLQQPLVQITYYSKLDMNWTQIGQGVFGQICQH